MKHVLDWTAGLGLTSVQEQDHGEVSVGRWRSSDAMSKYNVMPCQGEWKTESKCTIVVFSLLCVRGLCDYRDGM